MKKWNDIKILKREFFMGDEVLLFNSSLKLFVGKLKSKWPDPFIVVNVYPSKVIELEDHTKRRFIVNDQRLNHFYIGLLRASKVEALHFKDSC